MDMTTKDTEQKTILFLINDTDPVLLRVIRNKFKKDAGWESIISTKYDEAIASFERAQPDAVLTEIIIEDDKGRNGFDFIEEIKKKSDGKKVLTMIFTELSQEDDKEKADRLGVDKYFIKSKITLNELIEEIKQRVMVERHSAAAL